MTHDHVMEILPIISITIALGALLVSLWNNKVSRKALKISEQQFQNKLPAFSIYLIDCYSISLDVEKILLFHITLTNKSETKNSFEANLYIEYVGDDNNLRRYKLSHNPELLQKINRPLTVFEKDISLDGKQSSSKWAMFSYSKDFIPKKRIEKYVMSLKDVNGNEQNISSTIMKEIKNED